MTRAELPWLVKSSGRILGPFTAEKIGELLRTREISVLDEISKPLRRWQTIQYHEEFRDVVESMRKATLSEKTEATWTPVNQTNATQTLTDLVDGDLTEEISQVEGFTSTAKEIVIHNVKEQNQVAPFTGGRYQATVTNPAMQRQIEKTTRGLWVVTGIVLLVALGFIVQKRWSMNSETRLSPASLKQQIGNMVQAGRYTDALKELKSYFPDPNQSGDLAIYYGSLLIQVENQTVLGRRLLNMVIAQKKPEVKQAYTGLGVADLIDGQWDTAGNNFERALSIDPEYVPALTNLGYVQLQKGDYVNSKNTSLKALKLNPQQGEALLTLVEAQLFLYKSNSNLNELNQIDRKVREFIAHPGDFFGELGFYDLYIDYLNRDRSLNDRIQSYLDKDPRLTQDHRHNVFIYRGRAPSKIMARFCEQMTEQLGEDPRVSALKAGCNVTEQRWDLARKAIEKAVQQAPKDPLIQAWYSLVLKESGDPEQASVILGRATEFNRRNEFGLPTLLQARFCQQQNDVDCARQNYQRLYERDLEYLPAIAGQAWVHAQQKSFSEAIKNIDHGLKLSPYYIPLLTLRQRAEAEKWYETR